MVRPANRKPLQKVNCIQQYIDLLTNHQELIATGSCAPLNKARAEATTLLMETGLPSGKEERYRYTDVEAAFAPDYGLNLRRLAPKQNPYATYKCQVPNLSTSLFLVVNDVPCEVPDNVKAGLPEGVIIDSLCRVAKTRPELLSRYNTLASTDRGFKKGHDGVTLLNTALAQDGLLIYLPAGARLKHPLQVVNVSAANTNFMSVRRVLVVAETGAEGTILFCDHAQDSQVPHVSGRGGSDRRRHPAQPLLHRRNKRTKHTLFNPLCRTGCPQPTDLQLRDAYLRNGSQPCRCAPHG